MAEGRNLIIAFFCLWNRFTLTFWWRTRYVWRVIRSYTAAEPFQFPSTASFIIRWLILISGADIGAILLNSTQHPPLTAEQRVRLGLCCWLVSAISIGEICDIDSACRVLEILMAKDGNVVLSLLGGQKMWRCTLQNFNDGHKLFIPCKCLFEQLVRHDTQMGFLSPVCNLTQTIGLFRDVSGNNLQNMLCLQKEVVLACDSHFIILFILHHTSWALTLSLFWLS